MVENVFNVDECWAIMNQIGLTEQFKTDIGVMPTNVNTDM